MGRHLNHAKRFFGTDTRGLLDGGRNTLLYTRTVEFDELRPYVPGDDVRDIDWRASARSGAPGAFLIRKFVSEKHHKIAVVTDTGRNMTALAPSGETKRDIAVAVLGALGLIAARRSDQLALVYGDRRGCGHLPARRGETHAEAICERFYLATLHSPGPSDIVPQLGYMASGYRHRMLVVVLSDEPDTDDARLAAAVGALNGRHDLLWVMISDMPIIGSSDAELDGYDVTTGEFVLNGATLGPRVMAAYRQAETDRLARLQTWMADRAIRYVRIGSSAEIRTQLVDLTRDYHHAQ